MAAHDCNQVAIQNLLDGWFLPAVPANLPRFVVVVDIGQGNLNAIFNEAGQVFLYYDFGGGWKGNLFTFPNPAPVFCTEVAGDPKFIISNWDGDHIKSIVDRVGAAAFMNNKAWLAPKFEANSGAYTVRAGLSKKAKAARLSMGNSGELYKWPDDRHDGVGNVRSVTSSHFTVMRALGNDANNAGLTLRIQDPGGGARYMLLPGDASYQAGALAHGCDNACVALVASHHGGEIHTAAEIPHPLAAIEQAIAFSFGWGNGYGHPISSGHRYNKATNMQVPQLGIEHYDARGWDDIHRADTAGSEAGAELAGPRGNVGFIWPGARPGPGAVYGPATPNAINEAAVHLLASVAAEVEFYQAGLNVGGHIAAATAYQAAREAGARAASPIWGAAAVANALVNAQGAPVVTLTAVAQAIDNHVAAELAVALGVASAAATAAQNVGVQNLATAIANAVLTAASKAQVDITAAAGIGINDVNNANSVGSAACRLGLAAAVNPNTLIAVEGVISDLLADAVVLAATALDANNAPVRNNVKRGIAQAVIAISQHAIGNPKNRHLHTPMQSAKQPPAAAELAVAAVTAPIRPDVLVGIVAAAALAPSIPINPQAGAAGWPVVLNLYSLEAARAAAVGAIVGYQQNNAANRGQLVRAAVAGARIALPAATGAPQVNCHRHPKTCAITCSLSVHYFAQAKELLQITSLAPVLATVNGAQFTLTVNGANFRPNAVVRWGGANLVTVYVSETQVTATVPALQLGAVANVAVDVRLAGAGQLSNALTFKVMAPAPVITALSHTAAVINSGNFTLTITGTDFQNNAVATLGGTALTTRFVSNVQLDADVPANLLTAVGAFAVVVTNPDGRASVAAGFQVQLPRPVINSLNPNSATVGAVNAVTVQILGANFDPNSVVLAGVQVVPNPVFQNAGQIDFVVPVNVLQNVGTWQITVRNPDNQTSLPSPFDVKASLKRSIH